MKNYRCKQIPIIFYYKVITMKTSTTTKIFAIAGLLAVGASTAMADSPAKLRADLNGYNQVPSIYTNGTGTFQAAVYQGRIDYRIDFKNLSSNLNEAHIHFAQARDSGGTMVVFCAADSPKPCPQTKNGTIEGSLTAMDVQGIPEQNVTKGSLNQLVRAIANGAAYVNLHTVKIDGEVRGQIGVVK
jgi:hypothetical protein